jgi:predicted DNA-binding transcriptional regulator AlpA
VTPLLRFSDLQQRKIVKNRQTLKNWVGNPAIAFPPGRMTGPNTRTWTEEEVGAWLDNRPLAAQGLTGVRTAPKAHSGHCGALTAKHDPRANVESGGSK